MTEYEYQRKVVHRRLAAEAEEQKRDCENCQERVGIPCLKVYRCEKFKGRKDKQNEQV